MENFDKIKNCNTSQETLSQEDWYKIVKNKLNTSNFKILECSVRSFSDEQVGFLGEHLSLQATVLLEKEDETSEKINLEFFAKCLPRKNEEYESFINDTQSFYKEYRFYLDILPDLKKHRIDEELCWTSKCYLSKPNVIVLENLINRGFRHSDCKPSIDYKHCVVLVETLARFHAESVFFEEKTYSKLGEKYSDILFESFWMNKEGHPGYDFMRATSKAVINLLEHQPDYQTNQHKYKMVKEKYLEVTKETCEFVKPSKKYRNVICHGDLWASNIFFRYNENAEPVEVRLVDFQLFRYTPPAHDVMCFLYFVSNRDFRKKFLDEILTIYYKTFSSELEKCGLNADELQFSWTEFRESCEFYERAARILCVMYYQNIMMKGDYLKEKVFNSAENIQMFMRIDKSKYIIENYLNDPNFRARNHEAMQEMFQFCILNQ